MADGEERADVDGGQLEEEEEEAWLEAVPLDGLPHGNTTTFVGGFSAISSVAQALLLVKHKDDTIVVMPGTYDADVSLDSTAHNGLRIRGDSASEASAIVFKGLLDVAYSAPPPASTKTDAEEEDEAEKAKPAPPRPLLIGNMTFLGGAVFSELTDCDVDSCIFASVYVDATSAENVPRTVRVHGLSTVRLRDCTVYGMGRSAVYGYPHSRARFSSCRFFGARKAPPPAPESERRRKRVVAPPPPPPAVPQICECDVGLQLDDSSCTFNDCVIDLFTIGVAFSDKCVGCVLEKCTVTEVATVGVLVGSQSVATVRGCTVKLCGRECVVVGDKAHPTLRSNVLVGDARLKEGAIGTGISDNILGLNGQLFVDGGHFTVKGFTTVAKDPSIIKPKKIVEDE